MAFEKGGRADKLGNRHESRWVAKQLLRLLKEDIKSVTIEAIGDDEQGVDLWVELNNGIRQAQQCKARNASKEYWLINDLMSKDILSNLKFQLSRSAEVEFVFVSGVPATKFGDICVSARNSNGNSEDFYNFQIKASGSVRLKEFNQFCHGVSLNPHDIKDRAIAYDYLQRTKIEQFLDDDNEKDTLIMMASLLLSGNPETTIAKLLTYVENNDQLGKRIYADELYRYLETHNIYPKNFALDGRVMPAFEHLQKEFFDVINPGLIGKNLIPRDETQKCLAAIKENGVVILHGASGYGKSGVLFELTCALHNAGILYLPIRLDIRHPEKTAKHFGQAIGLPDSPAICLGAFAEERPCVLILDQLDAIRWTSTHSADALEVCKEMMRQVLSFQRDGRNISIVLACRTFDLNNDKGIKEWLANKDINRLSMIEIQLLPESCVLKLVGSDYEKMNERQRKIIATPQNLSMWVELGKQGELPLFKSSTELMKSFWELKKQKLELNGIAAHDIDKIINELVNWLEKYGKISMPRRLLLSCSMVALEVFQSQGVIHEQDKMISFCHQSYLDFLIAVRLVEQIYGGRNILDWLGSREEQTLFSREQLRQALALLADELPDEFLESIKQIILSKDIRFHLKHLVLEILSQTNVFSGSIADYCLALIHNDYWKSHVLEIIYVGNVGFVQLLIDNGLIEQWLNSKESSDINQALWLLRSVVDKVPDKVTEVLTPYADSGKGWPERILGTICWKISDDSKSMFDLRLQLIRSGFIPHHINWKDICSESPERAICIIDAVLFQIDIEHEGDKSSGRFELWEEHDLTSLFKVVEQYPLKMWELLIPYVEKYTAHYIGKYEPRLSKWQRGQPAFESFARSIVELLIKAGHGLAVNSPELLISCIKKIEDSSSQIIQEIIIESYTCLPSNYADISINWLLQDLNRLNLGNGAIEVEWKPAARLIQAHSPYCSQEIFEKLEYSLVNYHEPDEKATAKYCLKLWRNGHYDFYWGEAQYFLLPVLASERIHKKTFELIRILKRKFSSYPEERFLRHGHVSGGWIGSKLDKNLLSISDNAWLKIVCNKKVAINNVGHGIQVDDDTMVESSIFVFSSSLGKIAKWYPERFGKLALQFPEDINTHYISAILQAIALTEVDPNTPEVVKANWEPASVNTIEALFAKFCDLDDREVAISFCRLIRERATEVWSEDVVDKLLYLAVSHPDLEPDKLNVDCNKSASIASVNTLFQNTVNCVRGVAASAIANLLCHHSEMFEKFKPTIETLIKDTHPVVRMAAIEVLISVINISHDQAVEWFCEIAKDDVRIPASPYGRYFFYGYTLLKYTEKLVPILKKMLESENIDVSKIAVKTITAYYLRYGMFKEDFESCYRGALHKRVGVANVAVELIVDARYNNQCGDVLRILFNDDEKEVRCAVSRMFYKDKLLTLPENQALVIDYIKSKSFIDEFDGLFHCLKNHKESLVPFAELILHTCNILGLRVSEDTENFRGRLWNVPSELSLFLLTLYEQSQGTKTGLTNRCLDAWDILFEKRIGNTRELMKGID